MITQLISILQKSMGLLENLDPEQYHVHPAFLEISSTQEDFPLGYYSALLDATCMVPLTSFHIGQIQESHLMEMSQDRRNPVIVFIKYDIINGFFTSSWHQNIILIITVGNGTNGLGPFGGVCVGSRSPCCSGCPGPGCSLPGIGAGFSAKISIKNKM